MTLINLTLTHKQEIPVIPEKTKVEASIKIDNRDPAILLSEIPTISPHTKSVFAEQGHNFSANITYPLKGKIEALSITIAKLDEAKTNSTQDIVIGFLGSAVITAVLAFTIFGVMTSSVAVGIGGGLIYSLLGAFAAVASGHDNIASKEYIGPLFIWLTAPFLPICAAFSNVPNLEDNVKKRRQDIETHFPELITFFSQDHSELLKRLDEQTEKMKKVLKNTHQQLGENGPGTKELAMEIATYEQATNELKAAIAFYSKFNQ